MSEQRHYGALLYAVTTGQVVNSLETANTGQLTYLFPESVSFTQNTNLTEDTATIVFSLDELDAWARTTLVITSNLAPYGLAVKDLRYGTDVGRLQFAGEITKTVLDISTRTLEVELRGYAYSLTKQLAINTTITNPGSGVMIDTTATSGNWSVTGSLYGLIANISNHRAYYRRDFTEGRDTSGAHVKTINNWEMSTVADCLDEIFQRQYCPIVHYTGKLEKVGNIYYVTAVLDVLYSRTIASYPREWRLEPQDFATSPTLTVDTQNYAYEKWLASPQTNGTSNTFYARRWGNSVSKTVVDKTHNDVSNNDTAQSIIAQRAVSVASSFQITQPPRRADITTITEPQLGDIIRFRLFGLDFGGTQYDREYVGVVTTIQEENGTRTISTQGRTRQYSDTVPSEGWLEWCTNTDKDTVTLSSVFNGLSGSVGSVLSGRLLHT